MFKVAAIIGLLLVTFSAGAALTHYTGGDSAPSTAIPQLERIALQKTISAIAALSDEADMVPVITHVNDPCQEDEVLYWVEPGVRDCVAVDTLCSEQRRKEPPMGSRQLPS